MPAGRPQPDTACETEKIEHKMESRAASHTMGGPLSHRVKCLEEKMAIDPVCSMEIEERTAEFTSEYDSKTYYFCSEHCKEQFENDPEEYVAAA